MPTDLFDLAAKITADTKGAEQNLTATQQKVIKLANEFKQLDKATAKGGGLQSVTAGLQQMGPQLSGVSSKLSSLAAAGGPIGLTVAGLTAIATASIAATASIVEFTIASTKSADKINDLSAQLNLSTDTLQGLSILAQQSGSSIEQLSAGIGIFDKKVEEASDSFRKMGITSHDTEQALRQAFTALSKINDPVKQVAASLEMFGRSGKSMLGVLKQADGDVDKAISQFKAMGAVMDSSAIQKSNEFNDKLVVVNAQIDVLKTKIGMALLPVVESTMDEISTLLANNQRQIAAWSNIITVATEGAAVGFRVVLAAVRDVTAALDYLSSHKFSITYQLTVIGGVPVPIPTGIATTAIPQPSSGGSLGTGLFRSRPMGGGGGGGGGGGARGKQEVDHWKALHDAIKKAVDQMMRWRQLVPSGWSGEEADPVAGAAAKAAEVAAAKWDRLHEAINAAVESIKGWKQEMPSGWTQGAPTITDKIGEAAGAVSDIVNAQAQEDMRRQLEKAQDMARDLTNIISSSIHAGFHDGMKAGAITFAQGILQMIEMKALDRLASAITDAIMKGFGASSSSGTSGGGFLGFLGKALPFIGSALGGAFGGSGAGSHSSAPGHITTGGIGPAPHLAGGMDYVPYDNFAAYLHKGERVVPASQNGGGGGFHFHYHAPAGARVESRETVRQASEKYRRMMIKNAA